MIDLRRELILLLCAASASFGFCGCKSKAIHTTDLIIAYNVMYDEARDNYEIFTIGLDGEGVRNSTINGAVDRVYHAHGTKLYFLSDREEEPREFYLYEMESDGTDVRKISDIRMQESRLGSRKDGAELIVNPYLPGKDIFFILRTKDGAVLDTIDSGFESVNDPLFSPEGDRIVFRAKGGDSSEADHRHNELYIMNADGTGLKRLTYYPNDDTTAAELEYHAGSPRWNAGEDFISYPTVQGGKSRLYAVTPDGSKHWKLTDADYNEGRHDWSKDGRWLAVETFDDAQTQYHIRLVDWEKDSTHILTDTVYTHQQAPVFVERELL